MPVKSTATNGSSPITQASCPGGTYPTSPGPNSSSLPSSILTLAVYPILRMSYVEPDNFPFLQWVLHIFPNSIPVGSMLYQSWYFRLLQIQSCLSQMFWFHLGNSRPFSGSYLKFPSKISML